MSVTLSVITLIFTVVIVGTFIWIMYMWGRKRGFDDGYKYGQSQGFNLGRSTKPTKGAIKDVNGKILIEVPNDKRNELFNIEDRLSDLGVVFDVGAGTKQVENAEPRFVREWFIDGVNQQNIRFEVIDVKTVYED